MSKENIREITIEGDETAEKFIEFIKSVPPPTPEMIEKMRQSSRDARAISHVARIIVGGCFGYVMSHSIMYLEWEMLGVAIFGLGTFLLYQWWE